MKLRSERLASCRTETGMSVQRERARKFPQAALMLSLAAAPDDVLGRCIDGSQFAHRKSDLPDLRIIMRRRQSAMMACAAL